MSTLVTLADDESWVCPAGVTRATFRVWARGGNGSTGGYGGGGGAFSMSADVTVTPGHTYTRRHTMDHTLVEDGTGPVTVVSAKDGGRGDGGSAGGLASEGIGDTRYSGGNGSGPVHPYQSGGGGQGGSENGNGANAVDIFGAGGGGLYRGGDGNEQEEGPNVDADDGNDPNGGGGGCRPAGMAGNGAIGSATIEYNTVSTVVSVTGPANGSYKAGQNLDFEGTFSDAVTVTGAPCIDLNIGGVGRQCSYLSGSGTTVLEFRYTVQPGDTDTNGIGSTSPINMNGGGISADGVGILPTFSTPDTSAVLVDTTAPTVTSASINNLGTTLTVNFSESVTGGTGFTMSGWTLGAASGSGTSRTFSITPAVKPTDAPSLSYAPGNVQDVATNAMASFTGTHITNDSTVQSARTGTVSDDPDDPTVIFVSATVPFMGLTVTGSGTFRYALNGESINTTLNSSAVANGDLIVLMDPQGINKVQLYSENGETDQVHSLAALMYYR